MAKSTSTTRRVRPHPSPPANALPKADFTWARNLLQVTFTDASTDADGTIASRSWDFGDGSAPSTATNPVHTYATEDTFSVTLTVTDNLGGTNVVTKVVQTNQGRPVARFTFVVTNLSVAFNGSTSDDPGGSIASYDWLFGDGASDTVVSPTHVYATAATRNVRLRVTDNLGATNQVIKSVTTVNVSNQLPVANYTFSATYLAVNFTDTSTDPDGTIAARSWNFGDGSAPSTATNPSHTYAANGTYNVSLQVTDNSGGQSTVTKQVTVAAQTFPPTASFTFTTNQLVATFTSTSVANSGTLVSYLWSFGDGTTSTQQNPVKTYSISGTYTVQLTVRDSFNATDSDSQQVTVQSGTGTGIIYAAGCSFAEVQAAVNAAVDGNTVVIPACNAIWTSMITVSAAITIQGAGIGQTIITANQTVSGSTACFRLNTVAGKSYRITGIEFRDSGRTGFIQTGVVTWAGTSHSIRLDHCAFVVSDQRSVFITDWALGVIDHCTFSGREQKVFIGHGAWGGGTNGDGSWSALNSFGTADAVYIEYCTADSGTGSSQALTDAEFGGRFVVRYCDLTDSPVNNHGTQGNQLDRGTRQMEVYENTFRNLTNHPVDSRGGSAVVYNNEAVNSPDAGTFFMKVNDYRAVNLPGGRWGGANGFNAIDDNFAGGPMYTGTHTGATGATTLTDSTKAFPNLVGYSVQNVPQNRHSIITANTGTNVSYGSPTVGAGPIAWTNQQAYQIWRIDSSLDMPGMGKDDGLNRGSMVWPNQTIEGVYVWNNTINGAAAGIHNTAYPHIRSGVHIFTTAKPGYTAFTYPHPLAT